jgi:hypothetical protein
MRGEKTSGDITAGDITSVGKKRPGGQNVWKDKTSGRTKHLERKNVRKTKRPVGSGGTKRSETKDPFGLFSKHTY